MNKMTKKTEIDTTWLFVFYRFVIVWLVALAMFLLVKTYIVTEMDIQETHANLFMYNILHAKNGLSYYDPEIDRVFVGTILVADFQEPADLEARLNERMNYGNHSLVATELKLFDIEGNLLGTAYYNKEWYERWIIVARTFWKGAGSTTEYLENKTVLLLYSDKTTALGILQLSVVMPNS